MKKRILLFSCTLILASCGSDNTVIQTQQAQVDSIARVKAATQDVINQKRNDSTINAMAIAKADSIEKAEAKDNKHTGSIKTTVKDSVNHSAK